jgi:glucokinase
MGALLESGLVGNIGLKHLKVIKEDTINKWDKLGFLEGLKGQHITEAAREEDPVALAAFNTMANYLGAGIASLCAVIDPSCIVLGGGVIDAGEIFLTPTREAALRLIPFTGKHPYPDIVPAELGNNAGLVGVADLSRI